ncbi:MAG: Nif3-like dinuclear metal center hexameric protein [Planctomycetota bacterium]|nr:Nif3-like dinuclear metal center hexameric protein [Planctomycetota bacterium]
MKVGDLVRAMERLAPLGQAAEWDKVGLLVGDSARDLSGPVLLTIDLTERVLREAVEMRAGAVVAYHPPIWEPLTRITDATPRQRVLLRAIEAGLAVYAPHTSLDAASGGMTDWLCEGLSGSTQPGKILGDCRALVPHAREAPTQELKIVTFVPAASVEGVRDALASAGAGIIGQYTLCSFTTPGAGTYLGGEGTHPATGIPGRREEVAEVRLEMVCSRAALALALETLRRFHPYEEPAIDVYELVRQPRRNVGAGRRLQLDRPATVRELAERLKAFIRRPFVRFALADPDQDRVVSRVGVVCGAGGSHSREAARQGCEVFVTGEMAHHDVLGALHAGMSVILGGHTSTERGFLPRLRERLALEGFDARVSTMDRDILTTI